MIQSQGPLTVALRDAARRSVLCWLATVDADGQPNVSPKEVWAIADDQHVVIAHIASPVSARNIAQQPQVCLIDIGLPELDGNQVAQRLRSLPEMANAVLIAVTGYGQESDRKNALAAGFDHHLVKPVDTKRLAAILNEIIVP